MFQTCAVADVTYKQERLAITTYRVCYELAAECAQREWEFATKEMAELARHLFALRYPTARILANTSFYSSRSSEELERYEDRLHWLGKTTRQEEERILSLSQPA
jgi:hypothetical protein